MHIFPQALDTTSGTGAWTEVAQTPGGTDRQNTDRIYPYTGGSRFIQTGIMEVSAMARLGVSLLAIAAIAGQVTGRT